MNKCGLLKLPTDQRLIAPSLLAADFAQLGEQMHAAAHAGADLFHLDIMDGHFVPNLSFGPPVIAAVRPVSDLLFDVHLMLRQPRRYIQAFADAGADHITIHVEADDDIGETIAEIRALGLSAGIALKPATAIDAARPFLPDVQLVLVMTVEPGFGGQSFRADMLSKIEHVRQYIDELGADIHLEVDGGIAANTAKQVGASGANMLVAGTSVFRHSDGMHAAIRALRD